MTETIKVIGSFGVEKELTREEFRTRWENYVFEIHRLILSREDRQRVDDTLAFVRDLAGRNFDEILERQRKEEGEE